MQYHLNGFRSGDPDISPRKKERAEIEGEHGLPDKVDVLIAGCGPAGLCLAAQLARFPEIDTLIVEPKGGPMEKGQADGINVRSMEMFQAFGFAEKVKRESVWINETTFWTPDPEAPENIMRVGRVQDVEDGLSEMPHVLLNQARVHDMFLDIMRNSTSRLEPDYCIRLLDLKIDTDETDYPVTVTLERTDPERAGQIETVRANYVVGCDGARSNVRQAIGGRLTGDAAHQAWGVMDILAVTDFPDYRMKCIIQSKDQGTILVLPREGGYMVRLYVELDKLDESERVADRGLTVEDIIAKAKRILAPYTLDVKEVVWHSIYEIGHRLTDKFDDVPEDEVSKRHPRVFTAGDACHTHSPKAGQGMNVSMGDTFNLGWKLISVLTGRADASLLHSYSQERRAAAQGLVDYDHNWARVVGAAPSEAGDEMPAFQKQFIAGGRFTAGLTIQYESSALTGQPKHQHLATGFEIGTRFHSASVVRLADAKPMHLGHVVETGIRWTLFAFAENCSPSASNSKVAQLCNYLQTSEHSPLLKYHRKGDDPDTLIDLRAIYQQGFRDIEYSSLHAALRPSKGRYGLTDYEKVFCADLKSGCNIFDMRGINRTQGCLVIVRPDQYIANILPLDAYEELSRFFDGVFN